MKIFNTRGVEVLVAPVLLVLLIALYYTGFANKLIFDDIRVYQDAISSKELSFYFGFRSLWVVSYQLVHHYVGADLYWQRLLNVLVHGLNVLLLWVFTAKLMRRAMEDEARLPDRERIVQDRAYTMPAAVRVALPVAVALWAFNPVAVYAVQYLTQRSTLMATAFSLVMLLAFLEALDSRSLAKRLTWYAATVAAYLLALMSKEHAAPTLAILLPLYIYWRRPGRRQLSIASALLLVVGAVATALLINKKGWTIGIAAEDMVGSFIEQLEMLRPGAAKQVYALSVVNQMWLFFRYGLQWIIPWVGWMSIDVRPPFPLTWYAFPQIVGVFGFLVVVMGGVWLLLAYRGKRALLGLIFLVPAIYFLTEVAFVRIQEPFVLYRSYLWSIVLPALWVLFFATLFSERKWVVGIGAVLLGVFASLTFERIQSLRDERTVWLDAFEKIDVNAPGNVLGRWRAPLNLSKASIMEGDSLAGLRWAEIADKLGAPRGAAKLNIGSVLLSIGRADLALGYLLAAQAQGFGGPHLSAALATAYDMLGRAPEAFAAYDKALASSELNVDYRVGLLKQAGRLANIIGDYERAVKYFESLKELVPGDKSAILGLSYAHMKNKSFDVALAIVSNALRESDAAEFYFARANIHLAAGNRRAAEMDVNEALARDPGNSSYRDFRDKTLR